MKISYNWIKELVNFDLSPEDLADRLTMAGLAVDAVEHVGDDNILEFDLTSNRPDCLSHLGIAREVAAVTGGKLTIPEIKLEESSTKTDSISSVEILDPDLCPRYTARIIRGVRIGPSPTWLVKRLEALGQRSVNNVADITNYVMLETGQPLHAFDLNMLKGKKIIVRKANSGEEMTTLEGEERKLSGDMLVIADAERPVAMGGIKGGEDSGITNSTKDVLLEAAYFTPVQIRQTSKELALSTEASYRFERGTDPEVVPFASDRAAVMIREIAGGDITSGLIDVYPLKDDLRSSLKPIPFRRSRYTLLTGLEVELSDAEHILSNLGFDVDADVENDRLIAVPPSWRVDVSIEEDLIEEVARISGYDHVESTLPGSAGAGEYLFGEESRRAVRRTLTAHGYHEAVSFSFVNVNSDAEVSDVAEDRRMMLENPIDETQSHMRTTLLGGLLKALDHNFNHGSRNVKLFEIGKCFINTGDERPEESEKLALVATGARNEADWLSASYRIDFYDMKGDVESVIDSLNLEPAVFRATEKISYLHSGRAAVISVSREEIGTIGQVHPRVAARYKFRQPVFIAQLDLGRLLSAERLEPRYAPLPRFPVVTRDMALLIDRRVNYSDIESAIYDLKIPELISVKLFDIYSGRELRDGTHSMALSVRYRAADRTLTDEEIISAQNSIIARLKDMFGAELR